MIRTRGVMRPVACKMRVVFSTSSPVSGSSGCRIVCVVSVLSIAIAALSFSGSKLQFLPQAPHLGAKFGFHCLLAFVRQEAVAHAVEQDIVGRVNIEGKGVQEQPHVVVQVGVEEGRVVGIDSDGDTGGVQQPEWVSGDAVVDAQAEIAGRAEFQGNLSLFQVRYQLGVFDGAHAMPQAFGAQGVQRAPHAFGADRLSSVGNAVQARLPRLLEVGRVWLRRVALLRAAQPQRDYALVHALLRHRNRVFGASAIQGLVANIAHDIEDPAYLHAKLGLRPLPPAREAREVGIERDAEREGVRAGGEGHLGIAHVLARHIRSELVSDQFIILRRLEAARDGEVDFDEVQEVAESEPALHLLHRAHGQCNAVALRQRQQRCRLYRPFQMYMQFRLRYRLHIARNFFCHMFFPHEPFQVINTSSASIFEPETSRGLISRASRRSPRRCASRVTRRMTSASRSISAAGRPREPLSRAAPRNSESIFLMSSRVTGSTRTLLSRKTSTQIPPGATVTIWPQTPSRMTPTSSSIPSGRMGVTSTPAMRASGL